MASNYLRLLLMASVLCWFAANTGLAQESYDSNWDDGSLVISECKGGITPAYVMDTKAEVSEVLIYDVLGNYYATAPVINNSCCLSGLTNGVYMLKGIGFLGEEVFVKRWFKEDKLVEM